MVITDFDIVGVALKPSKTPAPLVVHTNTVLSSTIAPERLQAIAGRHTQKIQSCGSINQIELPLGTQRNVRRNRLDELPGEECGGSLVGECLDHIGSLMQVVSDVKRH
jgi:hypothetical protein